MEKSRYVSEHSYARNLNGAVFTESYPILAAYNSTLNDYDWSHAYFFFDRALSLSSVNDSMKIKLDMSLNSNTTTNAPRLIFEAITSNYSGNIHYDSVAVQRIQMDSVTWQGTQEFEFNITELISGRSVTGIRVKVDYSGLITRELGNVEEYSINITGIPECVLIKPNAQGVYAPSIAEQTDTTGTKVIQYQDDMNNIVVTDRINPAASGREEITTLVKYDSYGKMRQTLVKNGSSSFEEKASKSYNYIGKPKTESSAGVIKNYSYDYLGRPVREKHNGADSSKTINYFNCYKFIIKNRSRWSGNTKRRL